MIVCHCEVVSDREVAASCHRGAQTVEQVGMMTEAGTGCGGCHESIRAILERYCGPQDHSLEETDEAA
ncbi:(2Fe-2S)-binding protein [Naumannella sp. ID2617S]|nr:(2Fe-2S)-binding protein [Enemella dayhoffiae]NNG20778.1 (2Fe-2S)-binding protein [Naumannella sp. ID2617S]